MSGNLKTASIISLVLFIGSIWFLAGDEVSALYNKIDARTWYLGAVSIGLYAVSVLFQMADDWKQNRRMRKIVREEIKGNQA